MIHWWVKGLISIKKFKQLWIYRGGGPSLRVCRRQFNPLYPSTTLAISSTKKFSFTKLFSRTDSSFYNFI